MSFFTRLRSPKLFCYHLRSVPKVYVPKNNLHTNLRSSFLKERPPSKSFLQIRRGFYKIFRKPTETALKVKDDIPDAYIMIYRNAMSKYIHLAQLVVTASCTIVATLYIFTSSAEYTLDYEPWSKKTKHVENEAIYVISAFILFAVMLHVMVLRMPLRIYKVPGTSKYVCITPGGFPFATKQFKFKRGEVTFLGGTEIVPWNQNLFVFQSPTDIRKMILMDHYFRRPADFSIMLGEQRDPDVE